MELNIAEMTKILKHRYPFLLVDKVLEIEPIKYCKAVKNVTMNEMYFMGHFPECPIVPGVLLIESAAQTVALIYSGLEDDEIPVLLKVNEAKFSSPAKPGDVLIIEVESVKIHTLISQYKFSITCEGKKIASGLLSFGKLNKSKIYG